MNETKPVPAEFWQRLGRARTDSSGLRERGEKYARSLTGRPDTGSDPAKAPVAPLLYAWKEALNPAILDRDPIPQFKDSDNSDPIKRKRALVFEKLAEYFWETQQIRRRVIEVALEACEPDGISAANVEFDPLALEPCVTFIPTRNFDCDLDAKHPDIRFVRWMSIRKCIPLASARKLWPGWDFATDDIVGDPSYKDGTYHVTLEPEIDTENATAGNKTVSVWCVQIKGTDPYTRDRAYKPTKRRADEKPPEGALFEQGESVVAYFAFAKRSGTTEGECVLVELGREPWVDQHMYPKRDHFPITVLRLTVDQDSFWPRSMFDPVRGAADQANWAAKYEDEDARMSVMRIVLAAKQVLGKKKVEDIFKAGKNLVTHTVDTVDQAERAFKVLDFVRPNVIAANNADRSMMRFEMAARVNELTPQARSHESSAGAQLRSQISGARTGRPAEILTEFASEITQKMIQCARLHMTADQVAEIVGEEMLEFVTEPVVEDGEVDEVDPVTGQVTKVPGQVPKLDEAGNPIEVRYSKIWDEDASPYDILKETDLYIDPSSMRRLDKEAELQMLMQLKNAVQADLGFLAQLGVAPNPDAVARLLFGTTAKVAQMMGIDDFSLLLPNPEELVQVAQPDAGTGAAGGENIPNVDARSEAEAGGEAANEPGS